MSSLISEGQKAALQGVMLDLHDTWKLPFQAYKEQKKVILSHNPNYSSAYKNPQGLTNSTPVSKTIWARLYYVPKGLEVASPNISNQDALRLALAEIQLRIKIVKEDYEFLKDAERIEVEGQIYTIHSAERPHGLFNAQFYTIYLKRVD